MPQTVHVSIRPALLAILLGCASPAIAQIYKCVGSDGVVEYTNAPGSLNSGRNCEPMRSQTITTIPAPSLPAQSSTRPATSSSPSPAGFPKVAPAAQQARDNERRAILEDEMRKEEQRLAALRLEYKDGQPERLGSERNYQKYLDRVQSLKDEIERAEANLVLIRRELEGARKP